MCNKWHIFKAFVRQRVSEAARSAAGERVDIFVRMRGRLGCFLMGEVIRGRGREGEELQRGSGWDMEYSDGG